MSKSDFEFGMELLRSLKRDLEKDSRAKEAAIILGLAIDYINKVHETECCDIYWCPNVFEVECAVHGGFDTCCSNPELHENPEVVIHRLFDKLKEQDKKIIEVD